MSKNRVSSHSIIMDQCHQLGVEYEDMYKLTKPLLQQYCEGRRLAEETRINDYMIVDGQKKGIRRRFIEMVKKVKSFSTMEVRVFALGVACTSWFGALSDKLLDKMNIMTTDGREMVSILNMVYLDGEEKTDIAMQDYLHMSNGTYHRKKKDAIVLYGGIIYEYAVKREKEDIEAGLVDPPDFVL